MLAEERPGLLYWATLTSVRELEQVAERLQAMICSTFLFVKDYSRLLLKRPDFVATSSATKTKLPPPR